MPTKPISVILIDDQISTHKVVEELLETVDDIALVGQGTNGYEALRLYTEHHPEVVLMDVMMPGIDGVKATEQIIASDKDARILVLSGFHDDDSVLNMIQAGAKGYVLKVSLASDLINGIRVVASGAILLSEKAAETIFHNQRPSQQVDYGLTEREIEVLRCAAEGMGNKEIGQELVISVSTVKYHLTNIFEKMGVTTRSEAIVLAAKHNLL